VNAVLTWPTASCLLPHAAAVDETEQTGRFTTERAYVGPLDAISVPAHHAFIHALAAAGDLRCPPPPCLRLIRSRFGRHMRSSSHLNITSSGTTKVASYFTLNPAIIYFWLKLRSNAVCGHRKR